MKILFPAQESTFQHFAHYPGNTLDASDVGTGKTVVAGKLAKQWPGPVAVLCPKSVIPSWERALKEEGVKPLFVLNYEQIRGGKRKNILTKVGKKTMTWHLPPGTLMLVDEIHKCLVGGSLVTMASGETKKIEDIRIGDMVKTPMGPKPVLNTVRSGLKKCLSFIGDGWTLATSYDHLIRTPSGWKKASNIETQKDCVYLCGVRGSEERPDGPDEKVRGVLEIKNQEQALPRLWGDNKRPVWASSPLPCLRSKTKEEAGNKALRNVWDTNDQEARRFPVPPGEDMLLQKVRRKPPVPRLYHSPGIGGCTGREYAGITTKEPGSLRASMGGNEVQQPHGRCRHKAQGGRKGTCNEFSPGELLQDHDWGKRDRAYQSASGAARTTTSRVGCRVCVMAPAQHPRPDMALDAIGPCLPQEKMGGRSRWTKPQYAEGEGTGRPERGTPSQRRVEVTPAKEQGRLCGESSRILRVVEVGYKECFDLTVADAHCYYANRVLVHNCGSAWTQTSQMLIALVEQGYRVHGMSATAAENPTQMRALGYMLGLHGLNKSSPTKPGWIRWMEELGCRQDTWGGWCFTGKPERLAPLHRALFGESGPARRLTAADFPDSFRENRVFIEPVEFGAAKEIKQVYEDCGLTPEILIRFIELGTVTDSQHVLANIIRALQLAEALKVPELVVITKDLLEQGFSVPIFLNFRESSHALAQLLGGVPVIDGLTTGDGRQDIIDRFQADTETCVVVNSNAGGTGISLHDLNGNRQRVSLISPTFSVKTHMQVLGRTHRNGAKSDSVQKVLVAAGTLEEEVMEAVLRKAANLKMIHDGN